MADDYSLVNWPLPKMFGKEKYGYTMLDIDDPRYIKECSIMSQKLIRLQYDQQIIDLEWRKTYKAMLDAEHRLATLPHNATDKAKTQLKKEVTDCQKTLLEFQEQKDLYEKENADIHRRCDAIKTELKKERDLEDLRQHMEGKTKEKIHEESPFWRTKFNYRTQNATPKRVELP